MKLNQTKAKPEQPHLMIEYFSYQSRLYIYACMLQPTDMGKRKVKKPCSTLFTYSSPPLIRPPYLPGKCGHISQLITSETEK